MIAGGSSAYVVAVGDTTGDPWASCIRVLDGAYFPRCPIVAWGGWDAISRFPLKLPPTREDGSIDLQLMPQALIIYRDLGQAPVVVGLLSQGGVEPEPADTGSRGDDGSDPAPGSPPQRDDTTFVNGGSSFAIRSRGGRVEVRSSSSMECEVAEVFRVVKDGDASGRVPLAAPLLEYIGKLEATVQSLVTWARALQTSSTGGAPVTVYTGTSPGPINPSSVVSSVVVVPSSTEDSELGDTEEA